MCKMSCLLKSLVGKYPETDISDDAASAGMKKQSSIAKNLAFRYHPMLARLVSVRSSTQSTECHIRLFQVVPQV